MANVRLRDALNRSGFSVTALAGLLGVDPKTVERWVSQDRVPYPRHRSAIGAALKESETWLWPQANAGLSSQDAPAEVVDVFVRRASVPTDRWLQIFSNAAGFIDVLAYAALFLPEQQPAVVELLKRKAGEGVRVRLLMGDPDGEGVGRRGSEEGIGDAVAIKTRNALDLILRSLRPTSSVQLRLHDTTLYTSIYRGDDTMIANPHVHGLPAAQAPALYLRRLGPAGLFDTYSLMYDRIWNTATNAW